MSNDVRTPGREHMRNLLAKEYARCKAQVDNADMEIVRAKEALDEWTKERRKWAERAIVLAAELGDDFTVSRTVESELTEAWEFAASDPLNVRGNS